MALTAQQQNFMSRLQQMAQETRTLRNQIKEEIALYNAKGFGVDITDAELENIPSFEHLTQSDLWNCITALQGVIDALGDEVSGQLVNLIKMIG